MSFRYKREFLPSERGPIIVNVSQFVSAGEVAAVERTLDPFGIDDRCIISPTGMHQPYASCGAVTCLHCSKMFSWR